MSRSKKKAFIGWACGAESDKKDKQLINRMFRRFNKKLLKNINEDLDNLTYKTREVRDVWDMRKEGKQNIEYADCSKRRRWNIIDVEELKNKFRRK